MASVIGSVVKMPEPQATQVRCARDGAQHEWIVRVMRSDGSAILGMLKRMLGRDADVMDAFQDCFCKLAGRTDMRRPRRARAYIFRTAANIAIEMLRSRQRSRVCLSTLSARKAESHIDCAMGEAEDDACGPLREAIAVLPPHLRNIILLRDLAGMTYDQAGETLGISPATARVYRRHAIVKLSDLMNRESDDE